MAKKRFHGDATNSNSVASPSPQKGMYSSAFAGMPEEKLMMEYPKVGYNLEGYGDTRQSIDANAMDNHSQLMKNR